MATAKAYGQITIVDIGDLGTLSVQPESNQPYSVIYDPNINNGTYNPNWAGTGSALRLTPVIYYGGTNLAASNSAVSVTWTKKVGSGSETAIASANGETMDSSTKVLTVNKNTLNPSSANIITYLCEVNYTEPQTSTVLTAKGQITFSLIAQPTTIKSCSVIGESVFLYNTSNRLVGSSSIVLTAKLDNCSVSKWQYKNSSSVWTDIAGQTGATFTINATDSYFVNDVANIRLVTNVQDLYDIHTITKIHDGAPGDHAVIAVLSNEDQMIAFDNNGNAVSGAYEHAQSTVTVYDGNNDVTSDATITVTTSGVTGSYDASTYTYTVSALTSQNGLVTFTIVYDGETLVKHFSLVKIQAGADGVSPTIYSLESTTLALNKNISGVYSPSSFTVSAYSQTKTIKTSYSGRFKIYLNGSTTADYTSASNESSKSYTPSGDLSSIKIELYAAGATTTLLDTQTIVVTKDGNTGGQGPTGAGGMSFVLGNYSDVIPCNNSKKVSPARTITIPFTAYKGITRIACTASYSTLPSGMTLSSNTPGTASADGNLVFAIANNADLGGTSDANNAGNITITLTADGKTSTQTYTWTKNIQAADGNPAVVLQAYAPNGNIINNGENSVTLSTILTSGSNTVTSGITYQWAVFSNGSYVNITAADTKGGHSGYTTDTLTIPAPAVDSYASYRVTATYSGKTYQAYMSVYDKTDPLQVEIFSTLGDKITNSVGVGCVYARVYRNGEELDPLQNLKISTTAPTSPAANDVWVHIDSGTSSVIIKKWSGSAWTAYTPTYSCVYNWTFADYDGVQTTFNGSASSAAKFLYVSGNNINKKVQFNLEVTKS